MHIKIYILKKEKTTSKALGKFIPHNVFISDVNCIQKTTKQNINTIQTEKEGKNKRATDNIRRVNYRATASLELIFSTVV